MVESIDLEGEGSALVDALLSEVLEDLLERGLLHAVLLNVHVFLHGLDLAEQVTDGLVFTRHPHLVVVTALLNELDELEALAELLDHLEAIVMHEAELDQG